MDGTAHEPADAESWRNNFLTLFDRVPTPMAVCRADGEMFIANPAMATEWGSAPGQLRGRNLLDLFRPRDKAQVYRVVDAVRTGRRSRYPVEVRWPSGGYGPERIGELTVDPVGAPSLTTPPALLVILSTVQAPPDPPPPHSTASPVEARILALAASGATTAAIGKPLGLTVDGVNYHLTRLARRWRVQGRTALVAKAFTLGVLAPHTWPPSPATPPPE